MDNKVYKKVKGRYVPIGEFYDRDWLNDGLWLVSSKGCSITSAPYLAPYTKISDVPTMTISEICATKVYIERVLQGWREYEEVQRKEAQDKGEHGYTLSDWDKAKIAIQCIIKANQDEVKAQF